jgi:hypothetical protein
MEDSQPLANYFCFQFHDTHTRNILFLQHHLSLHDPLWVLFFFCILMQTFAHINTAFALLAVYTLFILFVILKPEIKNRNL